MNFNPFKRLTKWKFDHDMAKIDKLLNRIDDGNIPEGGTEYAEGEREAILKSCQNVMNSANNIIKNVKEIAAC